MHYIGIDLHHNNFVMCLMKGNEEVIHTGTFPTSPEGIAAFLKNVSPEDQIAVESTTNSFWFCQQVRDQVAEVVLVNSRQFKTLSSSVKKTDKNDAQLLAYHLMKGTLPRCREKTQEELDLKALVLARNQYVEARTTCYNKIHNLHVQNGIKLKKASLTSKKNLQALDLSSVNSVHHKILESERTVILQLIEVIRELDKAIEDHASKQKGYDDLTKIKGVGSNSAANFLSTTGNIQDFPTKKQFCAFWGMVPGVHQSNRSHRHGRITKKGCKVARKSLLQCTLVVIKEIREFRLIYEDLKRRRGHNRAIVATARKLLELIYDVLKTGRPYTDFLKDPYHYPAGVILAK